MGSSGEFDYQNFRCELIGLLLEPTNEEKENIPLTILVCVYIYIYVYLCYR